VNKNHFNNKDESLRVKQHFWSVIM
jgi:hypothetical protein